MKEFIKYKGKIRGWIEGDTFYSDRSTIDHFFRKFNGYGISVKILEVLEDRKIERVCLVLDGWKKLTTSPSVLVLKGKMWKDGEDDWQVILPLCEWREKLVWEEQSHLF